MRIVLILKILNIQFALINVKILWMSIMEITSMNLKRMIVTPNLLFQLVIVIHTTYMTEQSRVRSDWLAECWQNTRNRNRINKRTDKLTSGLMHSLSTGSALDHDVPCRHVMTWFSFETVNRNNFLQIFVFVWRVMILNLQANSSL